MITFKQLRALVALAECGHFGRAAERCAITQPALSMQIRELEERLGQPLVERGPKRVRLTPFGAEAARRAEDICDRTAALEALARDVGEPLSGALRLGVIPSIAPYFMPAFLPILRARKPDLRLEVREAVSASLIEAVREGALDGALMALPVDAAGMIEASLFEEPILLALPRGADARACSLLLLDEGHCLREQAMAACSGLGCALGDGVVASNLTTLAHLVAHGMGATVLPAMAIEVEARGLEIELAPLGEPQPTRTVGLVWRKSAPVARDMAALGELALEAWRGMRGLSGSSE